VNPTPTADALYGLFPNADDRPELVPVTPEEMPEPYRQLLVHTHHMTVTVEGHYGQAVNVKVLESVQGEHDYGRKILLALKETGEVVQFGIIDVDLDALSESVRREIVAGQTPLGRVLIQNNVLRSIQPAAFFRVLPSAKLCEWFGLSEPQTTYGRLGVIFTGDRPAIQVLEILAPILAPAQRMC
jgi:chorismate-pyruvate lyase